MRNPFEEKRKNDRINSLVKERDELRIKISDLEKEIDNLTTKLSAFEAACSVNDLLREENNKLRIKGESAYDDGYNQAVWDVTHFLTDKQKQLYEANT